MCLAWSLTTQWDDSWAGIHRKRLAIWRRADCLVASVMIVFTFLFLHERQIKHEEQQPEMVVGKVNHYFVSGIQESKCRCIFKPKDTKTHGQRIIVGLLNPLVLIYQAAANFFVAFRFTRRRLDENKHFWLRGLFSERESSVWLSTDFQDCLFAEWVRHFLGDGRRQATRRSFAPTLFGSAMLQSIACSNIWRLASSLTNITFITAIDCGD